MVHSIDPVFTFIRLSLPAPIAPASGRRREYEIVVATSDVTAEQLLPVEVTARRGNCPRDDCRLFG